jgi:hypothetical protein
MVKVSWFRDFQKKIIEFLDELGVFIGEKRIYTKKKNQIQRSAVKQFCTGHSLEWTGYANYNVLFVNRLFHRYRKRQKNVFDFIAIGVFFEFTCRTKFTFFYKKLLAIKHNSKKIGTPNQLLRTKFFPKKNMFSTSKKKRS